MLLEWYLKVFAPAWECLPGTEPFSINNLVDRWCFPGWVWSLKELLLHRWAIFSYPLPIIPPLYMHSTWSSHTSFIYTHTHKIEDTRPHTQCMYCTHTLTSCVQTHSLSFFTVVLYTHKFSLSPSLPWCPDICRVTMAMDAVNTVYTHT